MMGQDQSLHAVGWTWEGVAAPAAAERERRTTSRAPKLQGPLVLVPG
jgi:hypothetical protein